MGTMRSYIAYDSSRSGVQNMIGPAAMFREGAI